MRLLFDKQIQRAVSVMLLVVCTACSVVPGAMVEAVTEMSLPGAVSATAGQLSSLERSFAADIDKTLAASQRVLNKLKLQVDLLEYQKNGGYGLLFSGEEVRGQMTFRRHTTGLTTVNIGVRDIGREKSIEVAIFDMMEKKLERLRATAHFNKRGFNNIRSRPRINSDKLGIYRKHAKLNVRESATPGWLRLDLPSGKDAFLKGNKEHFRQRFLD